MRWSQYFIPTLREDPADAEVVSHKLLLRAGIVRQLSAGIYSYLPLGQRIALKVMQIMREEMNRIGGQEFYLPALHPAEVWQESGRWNAIGDDMFRLKDRKGADMCLGMTHEEIFTTIARNEIRSYKQLPQVWYQIQIKFRDEPRPKSGLMRLRTFIMKDAYTFDVDRAGLDKAFIDQREAYQKIFTRCGIEFSIVEASSGSMGGSESSEFVAKTDAGEDLVATNIRPAHAEEIRELLGAGAGSLGGVRAKELARSAKRDLLIIADNGLKGRHNMTTGANKDDHHLRGVDIERDIKPDRWADLRTISSGEACPRCDSGVLEVYKAMEIGHIFKLGTKYSESMGATVLTQDGKEVPIVMGSYGIGVERIISAAVEQNYDRDGIIWPKSIAPFDVIVTVTNVKDEKLRNEGEKLYKDLQQAGLEVLLDDRDERAGVKFKDADLIGVPYRLTVGKKIGDDIVELFDRRAKQSEDVKLGEIVSRLQKLSRVDS